MISLSPRHAVIDGPPRFIATLADNVILLSGRAVWYRWSESGISLRDGSGVRALRVRKGDPLILWGRTLEETEPVVVVASKENAVTVERERRRVRDGEIRVVVP